MARRGSNATYAPKLTTVGQGDRKHPELDPQGMRIKGLSLLTLAEMQASFSRQMLENPADGAFAT